MDAKAWDERYADSELVWSVEPNQFVAAECADLPPGRALDLAAGEGRNSIWLARRGWDVTAVDFSQAGLDKGRRLAGELEIEWVCGDVVTGVVSISTRTLDKLDHDGTTSRRVRPVCDRLPAAGRRGTACGSPTGFRVLAPGRDLPARRTRHHEPDRGHGRPAGRERADDRRGRARRPGRRRPTRSSGPNGSNARSTTGTAARPGRRRTTVWCASPAASATRCPVVADHRPGLGERGVVDADARRFEAEA